MNNIQLKLVIGGLLHDLSNIFDQNFLKNDINIVDSDILEQVLYKEKDLLSNPNMDSSLAYITLAADKMAAGIDGKADEDNYSKNIPLKSVFNILNDNNEDFSYSPIILNSNFNINYPTQNTKEFKESIYETINSNIKEAINKFEINENYINTLLEILEANFSFLPSSTSNKMLADISLYDHVKMTAAMGSCIYDYLEENEITNYKNVLYDNIKDFYTNKTFLLYSIDTSGIQDFIYTINSKGALKSLRARSFYLEVMMEHLIDELLSQTGKSRANLIYSGGGHAYLLLPNTNNIKEKITQYELAIQEWFLKNFNTAIYVACGQSPCSANDLRNEPSGSYKNLFKEVSKNLSAKKLNRYNAQEIIELNKIKHSSNVRECSVCKRSDQLTEDNKCFICDNLEKMSKSIINEDYFIVVEGRTDDVSLPLPVNKYLITCSEKKLNDKLKEDNSIRCYSKNRTASVPSTKLWVGDYNSSSTFEELAKASTGIERIAVLRADVDNLGQAFVSGFENKNSDDKYVNLLRTSTFSRKLSMFFKLHINSILENGEFCLSKDNNNKKRNAVIVYSGGDDVFIVGSWDDVIGLSIDLNNKLKEYSQNTLSISAGIGIYPSNYPISAIAKQVGELEENSKSMPDKNSITLFNKENCYSWDSLINNILGEKLKVVKDFINTSTERGNSFLYNILDLLRNKEEKINLARFAYLLARMEPNGKVEQYKKDLYRNHIKQMYYWMQNDEDCKELITAINIYIYLNRDKKEE